MRCVLLKLCMSKVIFYNPSDNWKYFIPQHIFIQRSNFHQWKMGQSMYYLTTRPDVQLLRVCMWASSIQWELLSDQNLQLCLLTETFNSKIASSEKAILKRKLGSWSVFLSCSKFIMLSKFHTTIKIIFIQLLYQINFIRIKLDFFFKFFAQPCD